MVWNDYFRIGIVERLIWRNFLFVLKWNFYCYNICYKLVIDGNRVFCKVFILLIICIGFGKDLL